MYMIVSSKEFIKKCGVEAHAALNNHMMFARDQILAIKMIIQVRVWARAR